MSKYIIETNEITGCADCKLEHDGGFGDPYCILTSIRNQDRNNIPKTCPLKKIENQDKAPTPPKYPIIKKAKGGMYG